MVEKNESCPCPRKNCVRHGNCQECRKHHAMSHSETSCERIQRKKSKK
ncbi:MAG: hypothetical protein ACFWUD_05420 [Thermocaproicibacter melissae]